MPARVASAVNLALWQGRDAPEDIFEFLLGHVLGSETVDAAFRCQPWDQAESGSDVLDALWVSPKYRSRVVREFNRMVDAGRSDGRLRYLHYLLIYKTDHPSYRTDMFGPFAMPEN